MSVPPLGRTSPTRTPATGSSSPSARGKTNQEGEVKDVRFVKGGVASPAPEDRVVPLSPQMGGAAVCSGGPGLGGRRTRGSNACVVKMDPPAPTQPVALAAGERPVPSGRRLAAASVSPNTRRAYSGALRRLDAWLAGRASRTRPWPSTSPSSTSRGEPPRARRRRWPRRASGLASPARRALPGNERPGSSRATGGLPVSAAGARRAPSGRRTWPPSSPPASVRGVESAASSPTRSPSSAAASTR